jgi:hypothetical protein
MALWTLPALPRLAQSETATVTKNKTDSYVLLALAGDVRGVQERLRLKQAIDAPHSVKLAVGRHVFSGTLACP